MAQSKEFVDASHALDDLSHALALLESENAKLREQAFYLMKGDLLHVLTDQEYIDQCERERLMQVSIDALDKDNAKLRELAAQMGEMLDCVICGRQVGCNWRDDGSCWYEIELRKLGVEVSDD